MPVKCDVSKEDEVERLVETAVEVFGRLDVMVSVVTFFLDKETEDETRYMANDLTRYPAFFLPSMCYSPFFLPSHPSLYLDLRSLPHCYHTIVFGLIRLASSTTPASCTPWTTTLSQPRKPSGTSPRRSTSKVSGTAASTRSSQ